jgi:hypothetical protein
MMSVGGPLAQVVRFNFNQSSGACPAYDPVLDRITKEVRKNRDDIEAQHVG